MDDNNKEKKQGTLADYKLYTRKLKAKVAWLKQKNEDLIIEVTELKKGKRIREKNELINFSLVFSKRIVKMQVNIVFPKIKNIRFFCIWKFPFSGSRSESF